MRSNPAHHLSFFIFQQENILRSIFNFSTSYGRLTNLKSLLGLSWVLYGLEKTFTKIFTYRRFFNKKILKNANCIFFCQKELRIIILRKLLTPFSLAHLCVDIWAFDSFTDERMFLNFRLFPKSIRYH